MERKRKEENPWPPKLCLGTDPGGGGPGPLIFGKVKIFLKLNFDFIVAKIRGVFGSVGVYVCVCVIP